MSLSANQFTTDKVRLSYVHLNQPHSSAPGGSNPKYSVTVLLPKSDVATKARLDAAYQAAVNAGVGAKWNDVMPPKIENPVYDGDGVRPNGDPFGAECKGCWVFTAGNKSPVQAVDISQNPVVNPSDIYSGMYARVCVSFYAYNFSGKRGIGCGLEAVQKLEDGDPLGGHVSVTDAFGGANAYTGAKTVTGAGIPAVQQPYQAYPTQYPPAYTSQPVQQPQYQQGYPTPTVDPITGQPIC